MRRALEIFTDAQISGSDRSLICTAPTRNFLSERSSSAQLLRRTPYEHAIENASFSSANADTPETISKSRDFAKHFRSDFLDSSVSAVGYYAEPTDGNSEIVPIHRPLRPDSRIRFPLAEALYEVLSHLRIDSSSLVSPCM